MEYGKALLNRDVKLPGVNLAVGKTTAKRAAGCDEEQRERRGAARSSDGQADGAPPAPAMEVSQEPANRSGGQTPERDSPEPDRGPILENNIWGPE